MMVVFKTSTTREPGCIGGGGGTAGGGAGGADGEGTNDSKRVTLLTLVFCCARDANVRRKYCRGAEGGDHFISQRATGDHLSSHHSE